MKPSYVKHFAFIVKKTSLSDDEFIDQWINEHAVLVKKMPGVIHYSVNFVDKNRFPQFGYDGFSELWYESEAARDASFESPEAKVAADDLPNFVERRLAILSHEYKFF